MKQKKRRLKTKTKIKAEKEKRLATIVFFVFISTLIVLSAYFGYQIFQLSPNENALPEPNLKFMPANLNSGLKAAIVDQLSLTFPDEKFMQDAVAILTKANYIVDYFSGEKVTVNFFRNLPTGKYKLVILRCHSTATNPDMTEGPVTLFTSERYDSKRYVNEQLTNQLVKVAYSIEEMKRGISYFGINPPFVTYGMRGNFQNAAVIMMGCEGLGNTLMAQAFINKGAKVYISWNRPVTASHTDLSTIRLLQHFLIENMTVKQAIQETYKELGADPGYDSLLIAYPLEALDYTIDDINKQ